MRHPGFTGRVLNLQWLGFQPCLELCGPRRSGWQLRGPFSLLLLQKFDRIGRSPLDCSAITANDDPRVQMGASALIANLKDWNYLAQMPAYPPLTWAKDKAILILINY